jgi:UDP-N-acetylmuramoyl-tripeptide--D-alanyl-D-alanine ligase
LKGANFNGNSFARSSIEKGAAFAVVDEEGCEGENIIRVDNCLDALQALAKHHRLQVNPRVLAITGSNGKTTTKELVSAVLKKKYRVHSTKGNLNNHIGVPLTLLSMPTDTEFLVIEIGANHPGEVESLCELALPDYAIVTSIGKEHLEGFLTMENIIETECSVYRFVEERKGIVFVNMDDEILVEKAPQQASMYYGRNRAADFVGASVKGELQLRLRWDSSFSALPNAPVIQTNLVGDYNFYNLMAAASVGKYFSVPYNEIQKALSEYTPDNHRSQLVQNENGIHIILDCYNANPSSMEEALISLSNAKVKPHIAVLGDMFELGEFSDEEHEAILKFALAKGIHQIFAVGEAFAKAADAIKSDAVQGFKELETFKQMMLVEHKQTQKESELLLTINVVMSLVN